MGKKSKSRYRGSNSYASDEPLWLEVSECSDAEMAMIQAAMTGDWIEAAMSLIQEIDIDRRCLWFDGQQFVIELRLDGSLMRLDPSIKKEAIRFGLEKHQVERFYARACQRVCRALRRSATNYPRQQ